MPKPTVPIGEISDKDQARFWAKVEQRSEDECWTWLGSLKGGGYGTLYVNGRLRGAHRLSFEIQNGPIPDGLFILHSCDNPSCVNPKHLRPGTDADNGADKRRRPLGPSERTFRTDRRQAIHNAALEMNALRSKLKLSYPEMGRALRLARALTRRSATQ